MKAIELANELDKLWDKSFRNPMVSKSADMLRQQAKEIEVLNQSYEILFKHRIEQEKKIFDLEEQLSAGKKSVNWDINNPSLCFITRA